MTTEPNLLDDDNFAALMRSMGAQGHSAAVVRPDGIPVPVDVVSSKSGHLYHRPGCAKFLRARPKITVLSDPPRWWSRRTTKAEPYDPHGDWRVRGRVACEACLPELQPAPPCTGETEPCAYCLEERRQRHFRGVVASSTGRKYHVQGCSSFPHYARINEITTLHVVRKNAQTGEPENVVLEPCKICCPPIITEPAP